MMKKRLMIALCCLVLLVQLLPIVPMAETPNGTEKKEEKWWNVPEELYYCREALKTLDNSEALLFAYDNIVAGVDACAPEIIISDDEHTISLAEFEMVLEATRRDHTEQFWMGSSYTPYILDETVVTKIVPTYTMTGDRLQDAKAAFLQAVDLMLERLTPDMSQYEMEKALHDMLAVKVTYASGDNSHSAYGALVDGLAVCEGYAEALQCLLQRVGIQSIEVFGESRGENHAWNMVRIDGEYYLVDLTWNDQNNILLYAYFNQTSAIFDEDHEQWMIGETEDDEILTCEVFDLPVCTAQTANYFTQEGLRVKDYTTDSVGKLLKEHDLSVSLFIDSNIDEFTQWYNDNILEIAKAAGVSGEFRYGNTQIGREIRIYLETCTHENMTWVAPKEPNCTQDGNIEHFVCEDCKKLFMVEYDSNGNRIEILNRESVVIYCAGHSWTGRDADLEGALVSLATNCQEYDTYRYFCSVCEQLSDTAFFTTEPGDHVDADGNGVCDLCNEGGSSFGLEQILEIVTSPAVLGGGGGAILLIIIIAIIRRIRG